LTDDAACDVLTNKIYTRDHYN